MFSKTFRVFRAPLGVRGQASSQNSQATAAASTPSPTESMESKMKAALGQRDYFGVSKLFNVSDLFKNRVHLGHHERLATEQMRPFIYGTRFGVSIIDLDQTAVLLRQSLNFLAHIAYRGGIILFVARQPQMVHLVERAAIECGEYTHCRPWKNNIFTAPQVTFGGEVRLPDAVVLLHTKIGTKDETHEAVVDSAKVGIPTVAVVDTDCNPNIITYPVPGNDDTLETTQLYLHLFKQAILMGKKKRTEELLN